MVRHVNQLKGRGRPSGVPCPRSGFRKERLGSEANCHLNDLAECIFVNVGGPYAEVSSPPKKHMGVGGPIVVRARESRVQGKGGQGIDVRWTTNRRSPWESSVEPGYPGRSDERRADDRAVGSRPSLESRMLGNRHVRFGEGSGETPSGCAPCSYSTPNPPEAPRIAPESGHEIKLGGDTGES